MSKFVEFDLCVVLYIVIVYHCCWLLLPIDSMPIPKLIYTCNQFTCSSIIILSIPCYDVQDRNEQQDNDSTMLDSMIVIYDSDGFDDGIGDDEL